MSIDRNTANANANAALTTIQTTADTNWIASVDSQIAQAISLGYFQITAITNPAVNLMNVYAYYTGLGYNVTFPDYANQNGQNLPSTIQDPTNYFGYNWVAYWQGLITLSLVQNPCRISIMWD
jgi:hypothetical protein